MDKISVIVPVYKVEAYLDKCVRSIVEQTYKNLEIILVDDGSPDRCGQICDEWAQRDSRIQVIHTENQGSGAARNAALDAAKGRYIAFVDSDDYIAPRMLEHLYCLMDEETDVAECGYITTQCDHADFNGEECVQVYQPHEAMKEHILDRSFCQVIWNKLFKHEVIGDIRFPVGKKIDDEFFTYQVLGRAGKLVRSGRRLYAYRQQADSVMHTIPVEIWFQSTEAKIMRHDYICAHFSDLIPYSLKSVVGHSLYLNQLAMRTADQETQKRIYEKTRDILKKYPLTCVIKANMTAKERFWFTLAEKNLRMTCRIRNLLKIGL